MAVKARGDFFRTPGSRSIDQNFQPVSVTVQAVSARRLRGSRLQKFVEERFTSIHYDLPKGLISSFEIGVPQLARIPLNEAESSVGNRVNASSNVAQESSRYSPRQNFLCGEDLQISSPCINVNIKGRLQPHVATRRSQGTPILQETNRLREDTNAEKRALPTASTTELKRNISQVDRGGCNLYMPSTRTTSEAIAVLKKRQQEGILIDSYTFVEVLKGCLKQTDLIAARQVHDCIIPCGMDKNPHVVNALLNVYIRCGRLQDARLVFDGLQKKTVVTWGIMIAGYAKNHNAEDALEVFNQMRKAGAQPDEITCVSILKACASPLALKWGKEVHAYTRHAGFESHVRVGTALVQMYAKCGCITEARRVFEKLGTNRNVITSTVMIRAYAVSGFMDDARLVFDELDKRDIIIWNTMIGAYSESGCGMEAYRLFLQMKREGFIPNAVTYLSILNACASAGALEWVKSVHNHALKAGLESDLRVGNALVHMYAKSGSIDDARLIFNRLKTRDVITWTTMIGAYAERGCGLEAYRLFVEMREEGFIPNAITYVTILNASASSGALEWVKEVHSHALRAGLESDMRVGIALVYMYAKIGSIQDARLVFDRMDKRDVIVWNTMIGAYAENGCGVEAYRLFLQMEREGFIPNFITYVSILNASASAGTLEWGKEVHSHALKAGLESDVRVGTALVQMYARTGSLYDARLIFDKVKRRDVVIWSIMIGAYAEIGRGAEAYELFLEMIEEGFIPNAVTYVSILNGFASAGALEWVKDVHSHALQAGLESDLRVGTAFVQMYAKSGSIDDSRLVFDRMEKRDVITWNIIIGAYAEIGCGLEAYRLFLQMQREGFIANEITYVNILNGSASSGALEWVKEVHSHALKAGLESDLRVGNALVQMYAKSGSIYYAQLVFDRMEKRDIVTWTTMIGGLAIHGRGHEALELFRKMDADCVNPDGTTFVALLSACCHAGLVNDGRKLFLAMTQDYGIEPTVVHCNCMVDLLGRAGHLEEAMLFIANMPVEPVGVTWKALLGACRTYGNVELGEVAANEVLKLDSTDASAHVLLSNIYAAAGKWEKVSLVRTMMKERGVRKEAGRSWIEVDGEIHDFVVGDTSHPEAKAIYSLLSKLTEILKTEGYIPDTQLVLQNIDEEDKELALCSHSEKLAIAYGLMHTPRGEPIRVYKNLRVCPDCHTATKFISKVTEREIIARDAHRFHHFKDGVCSCGDYW